MQIRCYNCHKPYAIGKQEAHAALDTMASQGLSHYDAPCPHCRRVNRVSRPELERAAPDWKPATEERASNG
jgi:phage FluMu protein Com